MLGAWGDLRASVRDFLALGPRESTLFALFIASGVFACLGQFAQLWLAPATADLGQGALMSRASGVLAAALIFRTLALYLVAWLIQLGARAAGGRGTPFETRAATAWAALVAAPVDLALAVVEALVAASAGITLYLEGAAYAVALAFSVAEVHRFGNAWVVLAALVAIPLGFGLAVAFAFGPAHPL